MPNSPDTEGLWATVTELAAMKGLKKAAVSERVTRLEQRGLLETRSGKGRSKLINVAAFDRAIGEVADLAREQGARTRRDAAGDITPTGAANSSYTREQARHMAYKADMAQMDLAERTNRILRADKVLEATTVGAEEIVRLIDQIVGWSDDIASAYDRGQSLAVRALLKVKVEELRTRIADRFSEMAVRAPAFDPSLPDLELETIAPEMPLEWSTSDGSETEPSSVSR